jgi:hypothetical protein
MLLDIGTALLDDYFVGCENYTDPEDDALARYVLVGTIWACHRVVNS